MPTSSGLAGACAMADTCAAETELIPSPLPAVASVTGESEAASREQLPPISNQKKKKKRSNTDLRAIQFGALSIFCGF